MDQGLLVVEDSRSHSGTPHSVGLLWMSDQPEPYVSTHNNHKCHKSMPSVGFEPDNTASERPQTIALDRAATAIGYLTR